MNAGKTVCVWMFLLFAMEAQGATIVLAASMDNTLYQDSSGSLSNGAGDYFFVGRSNHPPGTTDNPSSERGLIRRGLVAFDINVRHCRRLSRTIRHRMIHHQTRAATKRQGITIDRSSVGARAGNHLENGWAAGESMLG